MKTNYLSKALILLSIFILITCKKEYVEYVKKDDIVINDNTVIFEDEEWDKNIESIDTANNIIIMKNNATTSSIKEGDVLISASGEGMLRIVTSVDATDENIEFVTEQGVITDVIEQGELVFNEKLTIPQIKSVIYHMEGVELDTIDYKQTGEALFNFNINTVIYDHDGDPATTNDQIRLTGSFSCELQPDIIIKITFPAILNEARIGLIFNENLNLNLSADFQYNIPYKEKLVASIELAPVIIPIAGVPVVLTPKFDIKLGTIGYINLSINTGLQQSVSYNAGAKYTRNQGWSLYDNTSKDWGYYPPEIEANAGIKMSVIPELTIKLYGVVGPYFNMQLYGKLDADINQNPWWKLHGGINANVGAKVIVLDRTIAELPQTSIFSIEELIAEASGPIIRKPTVTTAEVTDITQTTAKAGGNVTSAGGGTVTERGIAYSISPNPTTSDNKVPSGSGTGTFTAMMTNLNEGTKYYVRAYATNTAGTSYGSQVSFTTNTTPESPPIADFTGSPTSGTAPLTVNFTDQSSNNPINWSWDFGDGTTSTQQNPSKTYNSAGTYTVKLTVTNNHGSDIHTKNNYITVSSGGGGGNGVPCPGTPTVTDIDGNVYNTVLIGDQCWMKENLKTTKYRNGTPIEYPGSNDYAWENNTTGAYAWYDNDISWKEKYGALYNWHAVNNANGLCPEGWHVPGDAEWTQLVDYVVSHGYPNEGANSNGAGNALKSCQQVNSPLGGDCATSEHPRWDENPSHYGFDVFGFSAFPGGLRFFDEGFPVVWNSGYWWSSTEYFSQHAWLRGICGHGAVTSFLNDFATDGFSVRCLRD